MILCRIFIANQTQVMRVTVSSHAHAAGGARRFWLLLRIVYRYVISSYRRTPEPLSRRTRVNPRDYLETTDAPYYMKSFRLSYMLIVMKI